MGVSSRTGMGAIPYEGGVTFRVWAPFAQGVAVSFNGSDLPPQPLSSEGNGYWSTDIDGAQAGDIYRFVITNPPLLPQPALKNDPYARSIGGSNQDSQVVYPGFPWTDIGYSTPSWNDTVLYQIHVGSFLTDPSSPTGLGTFSTVAQKLGYLADLGVNAIQLLPVNEFPGEYSMGYNPAYIFAVEDEFGGPVSLKQLVDAAHARGMAVFFDVVYNHLAPSDLWQFDGWSQDNGGGIYFYNDWRRHTPWGDTRYDFGRGEVRQYLRDNALQWLEEFHCDGLRWDATEFIRNANGSNNDPGSDLPDGWSLLQWINSEISNRQPWKLSIAEDMQDNDWITRGTGEGGAGFTSQWGAGFVHGIRDTLAQPNDQDRSMSQVAGLVAQKFNTDGFHRVIYTESHDEVAAMNGNCRVPELICPGNPMSYFSQKRSTLGAALVLTAPGIPMIFMGQEFLTGGAWQDSQPLYWSQATDFAGIRLLYHDLIHLRRNWFNTTRGLQGHNVNVFHINDQDKVLAFHRWDLGGAGDDVVVLANFANRSYGSYRIGVPRPGLWRVRFNSDWMGYSSIFGDTTCFDTWTDGASQDGMPAALSIGLGPYTAVILSQDA